MKVRKSKKIKTYSAKKLREIANTSKEEEYNFQCFRSFIWNKIYDAANRGIYKIDVSVTEYSVDFIQKIQRELLDNSISSSVWESSLSFSYNYYNMPNKYLTISWI